MTQDAVNVSQLQEFDEIVDVRSPSEYALDHIPGARNYPVLDDAERVRVGTMYVQESAFSAKKVGAALVARNIAGHLETAFAGKPKSWRPLVYCWRGGQRSAAMTIVLRQTGWDARRLAGGYKAFRRQVVHDIDRLAEGVSFRVICGLTGSGKSALLRALAACGAQVLDLEQAAAHRGSVLGDLPGDPQPTQKMFDSRTWDMLREFERTRPVYVEAESRKIGRLRVASSLIDRMRASPCILLDTASPARVDLLLREYAHFTRDHASLFTKLENLVRLHGKDAIERWKALAMAGDWRAFVLDLLNHHYDPAYRKSSEANYPGLKQARKIVATEANDAEFSALAADLIAHETDGTSLAHTCADLLS